mmetsp:Transcript_69695/g.110048  ORF Transcript_69695/g.110048 Transcript_69695/m.110048 type:complete len:254 (-) Transcript_69695:238-999(-)
MVSCRASCSVCRAAFLASQSLAFCSQLFFISANIFLSSSMESPCSESSRFRLTTSTCFSPIAFILRSKVLRRVEISVFLAVSTSEKLSTALSSESVSTLISSLVSSLMPDNMPTTMSGESVPRLAKKALTRCLTSLVMCRFASTARATRATWVVCCRNEAVSPPFKAVVAASTPSTTSFSSVTSLTNSSCSLPRCVSADFRVFSSAMRSSFKVFTSCCRAETSDSFLSISACEMGLVSAFWMLSSKEAMVFLQ